MNVGLLSASSAARWVDLPGKKETHNYLTKPGQPTSQPDDEMREMTMNEGQIDDDAIDL